MYSKPILPFSPKFSDFFTNSYLHICIYMYIQFFFSFTECFQKMIRILGQFQIFNFPMFHSSLIISILGCVVFHVEAQTSGPNFPSDDEQSNFEPSVAVVIGILAIMFALTFVLLVYAKFCHGRAYVGGNNHQRTGVISTSSRFSGIDKTVIEALPFFRFSSLRGSKEGLECAVCLSKFEDIEVLRLLPKCKHAFHISCIDHWLEKHSSCPLCRHRIGSEDLTFITYSDSMRVLWNSQSEHRQDSNIELFVQREEDCRSSSRFSIGSSFRKTEKAVDKEEELLIQEEVPDMSREDQKILHKHKHKIVVSDLEFKNRWSNVSSSDLMFLNSEMLNTMSSNRFSSAHLNHEPATATGNEEIMKIREEMEMKRLFENKVSTMNKNASASSPTFPSTSDYIATSAHASRTMNQGEKRSMSEITALSRFGNLGFKYRNKEPSLLENNVKEERMRRLWLPIARRTVQWFANREKRTQQPLDV
ncbi:E3 ubiquitin-protein ligase ATL42-like [Prunus avium]|uniref:RING-type E3 ubiquitin transferase n=1 Tax=Prunus avium TaxID=42229 RepID=A0A6P5RVV5_PRUAV|nr:E3 ubiquitin-protein ligase ATL42-like [Prunus avium]